MTSMRQSALARPTAHPPVRPSPGAPIARPTQPLARNRLLALEPRILFDGAGLATAGIGDGPGDGPQASAPDLVNGSIGDRSVGHEADTAADTAGDTAGDTAADQAVVAIAPGPMLKTGEPTPVAMSISLDKGAFADPEARAAALAVGGDALADADVAGADAGDAIHYAIRVTNLGPQAAFDLQLTDRLPDGFTAADVQALQLLDGQGQVIDIASGTVLRDAATGEAIRDASGFAAALFGDGVEFVDPGSGILGPAGDLSGRAGGTATDRGEEGADRPMPAPKTFTHAASRSFTIVYRIDLPTAVVAGSSLDNQASVTGAADREGGSNRIDPCAPPGDRAVVTVAGARLETELVATCEPHTAGNEVVIGEVLSYETRISLPEGTSPDARLVQTLDAGLGLVAIDRISVSNGVQIDPVDVAAIRPTDVEGGVANRFAIDFGTVVNGNRDNAAIESITIAWRAVVLNQPGNQAGAALQTRAHWHSDGPQPLPPLPIRPATSTGCEPPVPVCGPPAPQTEPGGPEVDRWADAGPVLIVEPELSVAVTPAGGDVLPGGLVTFVVTIYNDGPVDAFDVTSDPIALPAGLTLAAGSGEAPVVDVLRAGDSVSWTLSAEVGLSVVAGTALPVDVQIRYTSLPDKPGAGQGGDQQALACVRDVQDLSPFVAGEDQERSGADGRGGLNDYVASDVAEVVPVRAGDRPPESGRAGEPVGPLPPPAARADAASPEPLAPQSAPLTPLDGWTLAALFQPDRSGSPMDLLDVPVLDQIVQLPDIRQPDPEKLAVEKPVAADDDCVPEPVKPTRPAPVWVRPKTSLLLERLRPLSAPVSESRVPVKPRFVPPPVARPPAGC
jgi:uncharacterized repeat protein (TIGR01451 family)